jgi:hypothetical protein
MFSMAALPHKMQDILRPNIQQNVVQCSIVTELYMLAHNKRAMARSLATAQM